MDPSKAKQFTLSKVWPTTCHGRLPARNAQAGWMSEEYVPGLVSVIIPTYNRAHMVTEAMDSVWAQTYRPIELIVVDDGSTDDTPRVLEEWRAAHSDDPQFTLRTFRQENRGAPAARNLGLIESKGEFIQFLDSDDLLRRSKISNGVAIMAEEHDVDLVYSLREEMDSTTGQTFPWPRPLPDLESHLSPAEIVLRPLWCPLPIFRRPVVRSAGPWKEETSPHDDYEFTARCVSVARRARRDPLFQAICRHHGGPRLSQNPWGETAGLLSSMQAIRSLHDLVVGAPGPKQGPALRKLAGACMSCARVAAASGQRALARTILRDNGDILKHKRCGLFERRFWQLVSLLPDRVNRMIFRPIVRLKAAFRAQS